MESGENADFCHYAELPGIKHKNKNIFKKIIKKAHLLFMLKECDQVISYQDNASLLTEENSIWWKYWMKEGIDIWP